MNKENLTAKLNPPKLVKVFDANGKKITEQEAATILLFLRKLARIVVVKYLGK